MRQASTPVRSLHKTGLGINLGGTLFELLALNPSVARVSDKSERGRVLNEAWTRFQTIGTLAMGGTVATWRFGGPEGGRERHRPCPCRHKERPPRWGPHHERGVGDRGRIARQAPEGATPVESGAEPAPETPEEAPQSQRLGAFLGAATVALVAGVLGLSSALEGRAVERSQGALPRLFS